MSWFARLCRNTGLFIHHVTRPVKGQRQVISHRTEEKKLNPTVTLRRTTIEEIEVKPTDDHDNASPAQ
ncbi:MAG: hypothetical protein Kow00105_13510 [Phycisphaeraceae bacterium]